MTTFYPGPSRVHGKILNYCRDAFLDGVLSINHRSPEFEQIYKDCVIALKEKLSIPEDYVVMFASSATECWEILAQSLISKESYHIYNGAFGEKWYQYTKALKPEAKGFSFNMQEELDIAKLTVPSSAEIIAVTQNETSNGTAIDNRLIGDLRRKYSHPLIAVDATSSMAGVWLDFKNADIWYASVQKCFGLPAGLAVLICSPKALERTVAINEKAHYNSLLFMMEKMLLNQTTYTPNVLNIYLLMRVMQAVPTIAETEQKILSRYEAWIDFFKPLKSVRLLIDNEYARSKTVVTISASTETIKNIKTTAKTAGIIIGNGYGALKDSTFRIANFPAIKTKEIELLMDLMENHLN